MGGTDSKFYEPNNPLDPQNVLKRLDQLGFDDKEKSLLTSVRPELALIVARAKERYMEDHKGENPPKYTFKIDEGERSADYQKSRYDVGRTKPGVPGTVTGCDGVKNRSNHQGMRAIDFRIYDWNAKTSQYERQTDAKTGDGHNLRTDKPRTALDKKIPDYSTIAWYMNEAGRELTEKGVIRDPGLNFGAWRGNNIPNGDWGHVETLNYPKLSGADSEFCATQQLQDSGTAPPPQMAHAKHAAKDQTQLASAKTHGHRHASPSTKA